MIPHVHNGIGFLHLVGLRRELIKPEQIRVRIALVDDGTVGWQIIISETSALPVVADDVCYFVTAQIGCGLESRSVRIIVRIIPVGRQPVGVQIKRGLVESAIEYSNGPSGSSCMICHYEPAKAGTPLHGIIR